MGVGRWVDVGVGKLAKFVDLSGSGCYHGAWVSRFAKEDRRATGGLGVGGRIY